MMKCPQCNTPMKAVWKKGKPDAAKSSGWHCPQCGLRMNYHPTVKQWSESPAAPFSEALTPGIDLPAKCFPFGRPLRTEN